MPHIDFSEVKGIEPIPAGRYRLEVVGAKDALSKAKNEKINIRCKVLTGEYEGRQIFDDLTFAEESMWKVKQALLAMGFDAKYAGNVVAEDLVGCVFDGEVIIRSGQVNDETGEPYPPSNRINRFRPVGDLELEDLVS